MKKLLISVGLIMGSYIAVMAQDNVNRANTFYQLAETAFGQGNYKECIKEVENAELELKGSNPATLYLKIKAQFALFKVDRSYSMQLDSNFSRFEHQVDIAQYNPEKYQEIMSIQTQYNEMMSSARASLLRPQIDSISKLELKYEKMKFRPYWPIFGGLCIAGGVYFLTAKPTLKTTQDSTPIMTRTGTQILPSGKYNYTTVTDVTGYNNKVNQNRTIGIAAASVGGAIIAAWLIRMAVIHSKARRYRRELDLLRKGTTTSLTPTLQAGPNGYQMGFVLKF